MMEYVIKNGTICMEGEHFQSDLKIKDGRIWHIGKSVNSGSEVVIDAAGKYICPGGIDPHTHMDLQQSPQYRSCDTFYTGGIAAACGGTTTIIDHIAFGPQGCSLRYELDEYKKLAQDCPIDYSFHGVFQHINDNILQELGQIIDREGFPSFKAYTTYGYPMLAPQLIKILQVIKAHGGLLTVHAEDDTITNTLGKALRDDQLLPIEQALTKPNAAEAESVNMLLNIAHVVGDAPIYVVHVSAHESLEQIALARHGGQKNIFAETCPQYLVLTDEKFVEGGPEEAIKYMLDPPLRKKEDNQALWQGLRDGSVQVVATDHCPFKIEEKLEHVGDFRTCPGGVSGVEERMPLLFSEGVQKGRISLERFVQTTSTNAAKIFGLYPHKGTLQPGSDADLVIINPEQNRIFAKDNLRTTCGYSPYEGIEVGCTIDQVFLRGQLIAENNHFKGQKCYGKLLYRKRTVPYEEIVCRK
jgi:dihydropyrimidinase